MKTGCLLVAAVVCLLAPGCKKEETVGLVMPQHRQGPLTPGTRAQLESTGAVCSPNPTGPVVCTWTGASGASCTLTFDENDVLTHIQCMVDSLTWECTRPGCIYECSWSDEPSCADVYLLDGSFESYLCDAALQDRINQCTGSDGGPVSDGGRPEDAGNPDGAVVITDAGVVITDAGNDPCTGQSEQQCLMGANPVCQPFYCPDCNGVDQFNACGAAGNPPECPALVCPACDGLPQDQCEMSSACHGVYFDPQACACAPAGCCTVFDHCAAGPADCLGANQACDAATPHCEGAYVVAYSGVCYEGCALATACDPSPVMCTGTSPTFPTFASNCTLDQDCFAAIHQINCCGTDHALGLNVSEQSAFNFAEGICEGQYPGCGCADFGIECDDGVFVTDSAHVGVRCGANGTCTTYHIP